MAHATKINIKAPERACAPSVINVPSIDIQSVPFTLKGVTPLIVNCFSEKMQQQLADEATGARLRGKLGAKGKSPREPEKEFESARIRDRQGRDAFPCRYIKAALVTASKMPDFFASSTIVRQSVFCLDEFTPIISPTPPIMREDMVRRGRFGAKVPMVAYRPEFTEWSLNIVVEFEPKLISPAWLVYLVRRAGLSVGLGEWRPEKNGEYGRFDIADTGKSPAPDLSRAESA